MAELDKGYYDLKDEELVDFEGSDYGFNSEEELEIEEEVEKSNLMMEEESLSLEHVLEEEKSMDEVVVQEALVDEIPESALPTTKGEGAESGEIDEERDEKDEGVVLQPVVKSTPSRGGTKIEGKIGESRRKLRKADLEDGELDDAAMPDGSDHEADGNAEDEDEDENVRRGRKRRKERFAPERHSEDGERKERESTIAGASARHRSRGRGFESFGEKPVERAAIFSKSHGAGGRGMMQMGSFIRPPNMAPGIMGPGRPLIPLDLATQIPLRSIGRGFLAPMGGMPAPGRTNIQFQEAMFQEHIFRSHRMMQQLVNANGPGRPPMAVPVGPHSMRPMMGIDFGGAGPRGLIHLQSQTPDLSNQVSFVGPVDGYSRTARPGYGTGRGVGITGAMYPQIAGRMGASPRGMGRHSAWPAVSLPTTDVQAVGRGRVQGRGQINPAVWGDSQGMIIASPAAGPSQVPPGQSAGAGQGVNPPQSIGQGTVAVVPPKLRQGPQGTSTQGNRSQRDIPASKRYDGHTEPDGTWRIDDRSIENGQAQNARSDAGINRLANTTGSGVKRERENGRERSQGSNGNGLALVNSGSQGNASNISSSCASNLIQLGGPVVKSRVLTVSGLPENTYMSTVVEAFEKQGKVMDFKKEDRGDSYTVTFAREQDAVSAKRHMHRSILAGRQITVEYAVQKPEVYVG